MDMVRKLIADGIISPRQFERSEYWRGIETGVLVFSNVTHPQSFKIAEALKADILHSHGTGCTVKSNNYYFGYIRL